MFRFAHGWFSENKEWIGFMGEPMSEKLGRLPSVAFWIAITLLVAVLVICLLGSGIGLVVHD